MHLYLDEYGRYATPTIAQLLTEGRKFGIGTTIAHQTRAQIPDEENRAAELQVGSLLCFQLIGMDAQELSVAPEPQWEERVEEIEGTEPILAITQRPVDHLLQATHQNPDVRAATHQLLLPLQQERDGPWGYRVRQGMNLINSLLVDVMEGRTKPSAEGLADGLAEIVIVLRKLWISDEEIHFLKVDEVHDSIREYVNECLRSPELDSPDPPSPDLAMPAHAARLTDIFLQIWEENETKMRGSPPEDWGKFLTWEADRHKKRQKEKVAQLGVAISQLAFLCRELLANPIMVPSGQEKPRVRVRYITHPQRSYQDVQNELAVQLANLSRFTAYTSIQGGQHRLRLNPPAEGAIDKQRIERIRQVSKSRFGRPPEEPPAPPAAPEGPPQGSADQSIARDIPERSGDHGRLAFCA